MICHSLAAILNTCFISFLIWFFSYDTYRLVKKHEVSMHEDTRSLQKQLNLIWVLIIMQCLNIQTFRLLVQTAIYLLFALFPVNCLLVMMMVFNLNIPGIGSVMHLIISFIPTLNPICALTLISRLRKRMLLIFCFGGRAQIYSANL